MAESGADAEEAMSAKRYRKKPVVIEAMEWDGGWQSLVAACAWANAGDTDDDDPTLCYEFTALSDVTDSIDSVSVNTLEGPLRVSPGDWIIRGVQGEFYPCKPAIFAATYEPVPVADSGADELRALAGEGEAAVRRAHGLYGDNVPDAYLARLVPQMAAALRSAADREEARTVRDIRFAAWPDHEPSAVSGALCDAGDLAGDLLPSVAIRRLTEQRDAALAREEALRAALRAIDEDVREAFMHLEEVILSLPGRWNDPLVPDECSEALAAGYAALNAARVHRGDNTG